MQTQILNTSFPEDNTAHINPQRIPRVTPALQGHFLPFFKAKGALSVVIICFNSCPQTLGIVTDERCEHSLRRELPKA